MKSRRARPTCIGCRVWKPVRTRTAGSSRVAEDTTKGTASAGGRPARADELAADSLALPLGQDGQRRKPKPDRSPPPSPSSEWG